MWSSGLRDKIIILNISPEQGLHELKFSVKEVYYLPRNNCKVATFQITYSSSNLKKEPFQKPPGPPKWSLVRESYKQHEDPDNFRKIMNNNEYFICVFISSLKN